MGFGFRQAHRDRCGDGESVLAVRSKEMANESVYESTGRVVDHGLVESNLRAMSGEDSYTCGDSSKKRQDASVQTKRF